MSEKEYIVTWTFKRRASSHEEAAGYAVEMMWQVDSLRPLHFYVTDGLTSKVIDMTEDEE